MSLNAVYGYLGGTTENKLSIDQTNTILQTTIGIMFGLYGGLIIFIIHNIGRFVIKQRRYRFFHIAYFYILLTYVTILRITWLSVVLTITEEPTSFDFKLSKNE